MDSLGQPAAYGGGVRWVRRGGGLQAAPALVPGLPARQGCGAPFAGGPGAPAPRGSLPAPASSWCARGPRLQRDSWCRPRHAGEAASKRTAGSASCIARRQQAGAARGQGMPPGLLPLELAPDAVRRAVAAAPGCGAAWPAFKVHGSPAWFPRPPNTYARIHAHTCAHTPHKHAPERIMRSTTRRTAPSAPPRGSAGPSAGRLRPQQAPAAGAPLAPAAAG